MTSPSPVVPTGERVLLEALGRHLAADRIVADPAVLAGLSHDEAAWAPVGTAAVAVRACSEADVQAVVRIAAELCLPVVPRGAGTGLSGGANAVDRCIVLDLSRMTAVLDVDAENLVCVVQPGIVNNDLEAVLAEQGLWYPPDPASAPWSTIGGNVATNAGGLCCLKYGVTRDYVLGLRAVMGGPAGYGTAVGIGRRTTKGVAGYDLAGLMVGSEGTLGVITEATLRLRPALVGTPHTVVGAFGTLVAAGQAVATVTRRGLTRSALELLDRTCLRAVQEWKHLGIEADAPRCCSPGWTPRATRASLRRGHWRSRSRRPARCGPSSPPTLSRPRRCSRPAGWPIPLWNGSGPCSPRTSACPGPRCPRCSPSSRRSPRATT